MIEPKFLIEYRTTIWFNAVAKLLSPKTKNKALIFLMALSALIISRVLPMSKQVKK